MVNYQARIKPQYRGRFPQFKPSQWYDVEPRWASSKTRGVDLFGNRVARLKIGEEYTSLRAEYLTFRPHPDRVEQIA